MGAVTGRHVTRASATNTCLDLYLFLAGHSRVIALGRNLFSSAITVPNGHNSANYRTRVKFIFWLVLQNTESAPNGLLYLFRIR